MLNKKNIVLIFTVFLLFLMIFSFISNSSELNCTIQNNSKNPKFSASLEGAENIWVTNIERRANISSYDLIIIEDSLTIANLNNNPITSIFIGIPLIHSDDLIFFETTGIGKNTLLTERSYMIMNDYEMLSIYFDSPLLPQKSISVKFTHIYKDSLTYQDVGDQNITFNGYVYPLLPYKSKGEINAMFTLPQSTTNLYGGWGFEDPHLKIIFYSFNDIKDEIGSDYITPFLENLYDKKEIVIVYTDNELTQIEIKEIAREIFISPWGIIRVKEDFLIKNDGLIDVYTLSLQTPKIAKSIYLSDDLGEILGTTIDTTGTSKNLNINLLQNRLRLTPNSTFKFTLQYYLPFEEFFSLNWLQESIQIDILTTKYEYLGREQTIKIIIDGCYSIDYITDPPEAIEKSKGNTVLSYKSNYVSPLESKIIQFTFTIDLFDMLLRPIIFMLIISSIASIYVLIIKTRKKEYDLTAIKKEFIPIDEIREFCSLYEEKNALFLEIKQAEDDAKRKKMAKKKYKSILDKNTGKIEEIQKEIIPFKKTLMETTETFESIIKKLDILEAERVSVKDSLNLLETRYKRGRLPSRAAFLKLSDDFKKRGKKIDRNIDKFIQQLRSYLL